MFYFKLAKKLAFAAILIALSAVSFNLAADISNPPPPPSNNTTDSNNTSSSNTATPGTQYLALIAQYTYNIMVGLNNLPNYINSWMQADNSQSTQSIQGVFASVGNNYNNLINAQNSPQLRLQLAADMFGVNTSELQPPYSITTKGALKKPNIDINALTYSTLLGYPLIPPPGNTPPQADSAMRASAFSFIEYAAGTNLSHVPPSTSWKGNANAQTQYRNYYNAVMAIQSFNSYVMSGPYAEFLTGNSLSTAQNSLISQASSSSWIAQIATEPLGQVLRQLLMYTSQNYVLLAQSIQLQKQLLIAQVMTNTLAIINAQASESVFVSKAQGLNPT